VIVRPPAARVLVHRQAVDMRKSFDTLAAIVSTAMKRDVLEGDVFVFVGKRRRRAKVLYWDGTGLIVVAKRMVRGRFAAPWERRGDGLLRWTLSELSLFLEGNEMIARMALSPPAWERSERKIVFE
jgi:transposase